MTQTAPWYQATWWSSALYIVFVLLNHFFQLGLDPLYLIALVLPILALIFRDGWVEVQRIQLEIQRLRVEEARIHAKAA